MVAIARSSRLGLNNKEKKNYSLVRAINDHLRGSFEQPTFTSFEKEIHEEIARKAGKVSQGIFLPLEDLTIQKRDLNVGTFSAGGALVQTTILAQEFIEMLRNTSMCLQFGVRQLKGLKGNVDIPKQTAATQGYWISENTVIPESDLAVSQVKLRPTTLGSITRYSRRLFLQSSIQIEQLILEDLARTLALSIDDAIINGTGKNNQPLGILNNPNCNVISLGANGGQIDYASLVTMLARLKNANAANLGPLSWMMNPLVEGLLRITAL